jgi:Cof subfamily protein (haloacid dehalogenase superfamily)
LQNLLKKTVKLIALDLDGTIVREDQTISAEDRNAIARARRAGVTVVIATGRIYPTAVQWISDLNITAPVICSNGADIREGGATVAGTPIPKEQLEKAYHMAEKYGAQRFIFSGDHIYCTNDVYHKTLFEKWGLEKVKNGLVRYCGNFDDLMKTAGENAIKLLVCTADESRQPEILAGLKALSGVDVVLGETLHFELTAKGVHKGAALKTLAQKLSVNMENIMAIGDSMNDFEMIRGAGLGVAMGNAMPELLKVADAVTLPIPENGVAHAIGKYVFGEQADISDRDIVLPGVYQTNP